MKKSGGGNAVRMLSVLLCIAALCLTLSACGAKDAGAVTLTGVFGSETVNIAGEYTAVGKPVLCGSSLCTYALEKTDRDDRVYISVDDTVSGEVCFIRVPIELDEICFAVDDGGNALLMCREAMGLSLRLVNGSGVVWSLDLKDMMTVPAGENGSERVLYSGGMWYVILGSEIGVVSPDGKPAGHLTEDDPFIVSFAAEDGVHAVTAKRHLILNGANAEYGVSWENRIPERMSVYPVDGSRFLSLSGSGADITDTISGQTSEFISWVNSGIDSGGLSDIYYISDNVIYIYRSIPDKNAVLKLTRMPDIVLDRGKIAVVTCPGGLWLSDIGRAALRFNAGQTDYRAVIDEIGGEDYEAALDLKLAQGSAGDIVMLPGRSSEEKYVGKNIFLDLYDGVVDKGDIFGCVRKLYEKDGHVYALPRTFAAQWYSYADRELDIGSGWTYGGMIGLLDGGKRLFDNEFIGLFNYQFRSCWYANILHGGGFDRDMFVEYCQRFIRIKEANRDYRSYTRSGNIWLEGKAVLYEADGGLLDYIKSKAVWGEGAEVGFAGMPTPDGGGHFVTPSETCGILKKAAGAEGAKAFLRYYMGAGFAEEREYYDNLSRIPSLVSAYRVLCGRNSETTKYYFIPYDLSFNYAGWPEYTDELYGAKGYCAANDKALHDEFAAFLDSMEPLPVYPEELTDIIEEELSAVEGGRDVSEIADICENRVSLWLAEHDY
ncbi:MAG: hypothetical protein K6D94_06960 [Clostridiales bacterium]|nr:hypothetical protein [Clostridiales bacterium]